MTNVTSRSVTSRDARDGIHANADDSNSTLFELGSPSTPRSASDLHQAVFDAWTSARKQSFPSSHSPKLDGVRRKAIDGALALGYSVDDLRAAVQGIVWRGDTHSSRAETLVWALRDAASIDNCIAVAEEKRARRAALDAVEIRGGERAHV